MLQKTATATIERVITTTEPTSGVKIANQLKEAGELNPTIPSDLVFDPANVYTLVRGISARVNNNHDGWPRHELLGEVEDRDGNKLSAHNDSYGYRTFVGKHNHLDHNNTPSLGPTNPLHHPRGVILAARYIEDPLDESSPEFPAMHGVPDPIAREAGCDAWVELLIANHRPTWPKLCEGIESGAVTKVSMGAEIVNSQCSACGNIARHAAEFCMCVVSRRGQKMRAEAGSPYVKLGLIREGDDVIAHERNHGVEFFEISWISDEQADPTAVLTERIQNEEPQSDVKEVIAASAQPLARRGHSSPIAITARNADEARRIVADRAERDERREERREDSGEEEPEGLAAGEMDLRRPPDEQEGVFYPTYPFPCSALTAAAEANPDDPVDVIVNVGKCQGCMYNRSDLVGSVDCAHPEVVRPEGADPLPLGYEPVPESERESSGFYTTDGTPIRMLPGLRSGSSKRRARRRRRLARRTRREG